MLRNEKTEGSYITDTDKANGHLENRFNAQKLGNERQNSRVGMQLVGEALGQVSDGLNDAGVWGFDESSVKGDIGRIGLEAAGSAVIAGITGGNAGAALGAAVGGSSGAINGASIASIINQYNDTAFGLMIEVIKKGYAEEAQKLRRAELRMPMTQIYSAAFKDDGTGYYNADKTVNTNSVPPPEYRLPTEDELRNDYGIDGYKGLSAILDRPNDANGDETDMVAALYVPTDRKNPNTPPMFVIQGTKSPHDFGVDLEQAPGLTPPDYQAAGEIGDRLHELFVNQGSHGVQPMVGGESLGDALATVMASHAGMNMTGYNGASVHPNNMPNNNLAIQQAHTSVVGEGLGPLESLVHETTVIIAAVTGGVGIMPIVPGPPVNDPAHGVTVGKTPPAPGSGSWFPGYYLHLNTGATPSAWLDYANRKKNMSDKIHHK